MVSEKQKASARKWDRANMRSLSCRLRTEEANLFKEFCAANNTTPGGYLKKVVLDCIENYQNEKNGKGKKKSKKAE